MELTVTRPTLLSDSPETGVRTFPDLHGLVRPSYVRRVDLTSYYYLQSTMVPNRILWSLALQSLSFLSWVAVRKPLSWTSAAANSTLHFLRAKV